MKKTMILIITASVIMGCNSRDTNSTSATDTFAHNDSATRMGDTGHMNSGGAEGMQGGTGTGAQGGMHGGDGIQGGDGTSGNTGTQGGNSNSPATPADAATTTFLQKAADGGMAEVEAGKMGQQMGSNAAVKSFAAMMVQDHTGANAEVTRLAGQRGVQLPATVSTEKQKKAQQMLSKKGKDFDVAYMNMMVEEHKATIQLFQKAQTTTQDQTVKSFITTTIPKLKMHLDSAQAIAARVKKSK